MLILRPSLIALLLGAPASIVAAQSANPLAGATQQAQEASFGPVAAPAASRGKLEADPASGGQVFTDEAGWYRFTMANGGTTQVQDTLRTFQFESGGQNAVCFAVRTVNNAFASFDMSQIQAEIESLYEPFDASVTSGGANILHRETIVLDATGQNNAAPLKVLAWDTSDANGMLLTYTLAPLPAGQLIFACGVGSASHAREIIQRYLRIAEGAVIPAR